MNSSIPSSCENIQIDSRSISFFSNYPPPAIENPHVVETLSNNVIQELITCSPPLEEFPVDFIISSFKMIRYSQTVSKEKKHELRKKVLNSITHFQNFSIKQAFKKNSEISHLFLSCCEREILKSLNYINTAINEDDYEKHKLIEHMKIATIAINKFHLLNEDIKFSIMSIRESIAFDIDIHLRPMSEYFEFRQNMLNKIWYFTEDQEKEWMMI